MKDTVITTLAGLGGTFLGASSALLAAFMSNKAQDRRVLLEHSRLDHWKLADLKRERLEELFIEFETWQKYLTLTLMLSLTYMEGSIGKEEFDELVKQAGAARPIRFERVEFLAAAYFPSLQQLLQQVIQYRDQANRMRPIGRARGPQHSSGEHLKEFEKVLDALGETCDRFKAALTKEAMLTLAHEAETK